MQPWDLLTQFALQYGFLGVFIISVLGSSTVVVPIPYTLVIYFLGPVMDPVVLAVAGGTGASIGVLSGYFLGYYGRAAISADQQRKINFLVKIFGGHMSTAIFLFAFTPLPDALIFIPLGISRYSLFKIWIPNLLGKVLMSYVLAVTGRLSIGLILVVFGEAGGWISFFASTGLLILLLILMFKIDWEKIFEKYFVRWLKVRESDS